MASFDEYVVPGASDPVVTCRACPGRQLLAVQQVTTRQAARDKAETSFTANYMPLDARLTATRVALSCEDWLTIWAAANKILLAQV
jgi:hypothetical protein